MPLLPPTVASHQGPRPEDGGWLSPSSLALLASRSGAITLPGGWRGLTGSTTVRTIHTHAGGWRVAVGWHPGPYGR